MLGFVGFVVAARRRGASDDDISVGRLEAGDCVDTPDGPAPSDGIEELPERDCDEPHDAEVYLVDDVTLDGDDYPGEERVDAEVEDGLRGPRRSRTTSASRTPTASTRCYYAVPERASRGTLGDRSASSAWSSAPTARRLTESVEGAASDGWYSACSREGV